MRESLQRIDPPFPKTSKIRRLPTNRTSGTLVPLKNGNFMNRTKRVDLKPGLKVLIVLKKDQRTGKLTEGLVRDILTKSPTHPHGIKVRLVSGLVGRVKEILA